MRYFESNEEMIAVIRGRIKPKELPQVAPVVEIPPVVEPIEEPVEVIDYQSMTKAELFKVAEEKGIEVAKKATKAQLIEAIGGK